MTADKKRQRTAVLRSTAMLPPTLLPACDTDMSTAIDRAEHVLHEAESGRVQSNTRTFAWPTAFEWFFVIGGGLVLFLPFILWMGENELRGAGKIQWYFWVSALISAPHVYSTYVRQYRKTREGKVSWLLGVPSYLAIVLGLWGISFTPYFVETITAVNVWQSYHYLRQTYGIGCLYGSQANFDDMIRRLRWWSYHLCFPYLILSRWDTLYEAWQGASYNIIPVQFDDMLMRWLMLMMFGGIYVQLVLEAVLLYRNRWKYRPTGLICFAMFLGVHYYGFSVLSHFQRGFFAVTIFHSLQYLALIWVLERKHYISKGVRWLELVPNLVGFLMFWLVMFVLGFGWEQKITISLNHWWTMASTILLAAISVHHYVVDSFLWRRPVGS